MIETPKMFPGRKFQLFNFIWRSNYFEQQNTDRHNSSNILIPCLYLSRGQNPCWQTTQTSSGGTFAPRSTVLGGGWIHWTGSNRFTRSVTQRCFSPLLWFSNHSLSDKCTSQLSQLCSRFGPKIVAFCLIRQLSRREAGEEAEAWAIKLWLNFQVSYTFDPNDDATWQMPQTSSRCWLSFSFSLVRAFWCPSSMLQVGSMIFENERKMGNKPLCLPY